MLLAIRLSRPRSWVIDRARGSSAIVARRLPVQCSSVTCRDQMDCLPARQWPAYDDAPISHLARRGILLCMLQVENVDPWPARHGRRRRLDANISPGQCDFPRFELSVLDEVIRWCHPLRLKLGVLHPPGDDRCPERLMVKTPPSGVCRTACANSSAPPCPTTCDQRSACSMEK